MEPKDGKYLFLGVGGMGMAPLAGWMGASGYSVCGYDDHLTERVRRYLIREGVELANLVIPEMLSAFTTVVYSSAIRQTHPLLEAARKHGLPTLRRGEMLARIASGKKLIAVVGSHGKTTSTGMIGHIVHRHGFDANYILGGLFNSPEIAPSRVGASEWLVAEVDESDGTIDHFSPEITVILNIDWDHADRYSTETQLHGAFQELVQRTRSAILISSESGLNALFDGVGAGEILTFGPGGDFLVTSGTDGRLQIRNRFSPATLNAPPVGRFNQINAAAALSVAHLLGAAIEADAVSSFQGMARRQTVLHRSDALTIVEDYAHHPTEISALLECLRLMEPGKRLVVVFQAHRFSRTKQFKAAFAEALGKVGPLFLLPLYSAHETEIEGGTLESLVAAFGVKRPQCLPMHFDAFHTLWSTVKMEPSLVAFVGAGDIDQFGAVFTSLIRKQFDAREAWFDYLADRVSPECVLKADEPLAPKTTMRVGGAARYYAEPATLSDLRALLRAAKLFALPVFYLGRGSNLLVPDEGYGGLVIRLSAAAWRQSEVLDGDRLWVGAGVRLKEICGIATKAGMGGFEFLEGIPGALGGALRMNAGAMGSWMFDVVERVQMLDAEGQLLDLPKEAFHFGYRKVEEISRGLALGAVLKSPERRDAVAIRTRIDSYSSHRRESQPRRPSAGCIFKNPEGAFAGHLIDVHEIKGMRVGAAEVSEVHGNFIVNRGGATAGEVIELVRRVRAAVKAKSGYDLEPEVLLLGQSWESVLRDAKEGGSHE